MCMCTAIQKCIREFRRNTDTMHMILKSVCMFVCMCVFVCLPVGARVCMWEHVCVLACTYVCESVCAYVWGRHVSMYVCLSIGMWGCVILCVCKIVSQRV